MNRRSGWWAVAGRPSDRSPVMTVARSVADVVSEHVVFEVDCIDRMYLNAYAPGLQYAPGLVAYVHRQLGLPVASTASWPASPMRSAPQCTGSPATTACRGSIS